MQEQQMVNENYEPNEREEPVLELFKEGRESGEPWGRVNPLYLRESSDLDKGQVEYALRNLKNAGWVKQLNRGGLYELVDDPRDD
jgi:DNA-binding IclR family transcriptional regulator